VFTSDCTLNPTNGGRPLRVVAPYGDGGPCVQGSEWSSTSRVILRQWHNTI